MDAEKLTEIIADALARCEPGKVGFEKLRGCHRDRLIARASAAISAVQQSGYVITPKHRAGAAQHGMSAAS